MNRLTVVAALLLCSSADSADAPRVYPTGERPNDSRLEDLQNLNGYFPFQNVKDKTEWAKRQQEIRQRILLSQGLWPEPPKSALNAVVHGRLEFDDYTVERVYFESIPGHFVTGSLYRPKGKKGPFPAVLCPHGHWSNARFYDAGEAAARGYLASGAERYMSAARNHIQARCVQLARMGCLAFFYDMTGNCDSIQLPHRPNSSDHLDTAENWGFFSVQADLRLQNMMGLQTWNSVRSIDFLLELPDVDPQRIGVTGASGGGTQSMIIAAIDERVTAAMPCVMVSTAMQGGCTCENAPLMRIGQGNVDIAAAIAPRPLALTAADDWTRELETKGYPDLQNLYEMLGVKDRLTAVFHIHFPHNYNHVNRTVMYAFFNRHFHLGFRPPILERDFQRLTREQLTVWNDEHPAPSGNQVGDAHEIALLNTVTEAVEEQITELIPDAEDDLPQFRAVVGTAWNTILGRNLDDVESVQLAETKRGEHGGFAVVLGRLRHPKRSEEVPVMKLSVRDGLQKGIVLWLTESGKSGLLDGKKVRPEVAEILTKGYTVTGADLFGQGEFQSDGKPLQNQRMWYQRGGDETWKRYSGYTYGYNHPLFVQRAHDILSLIRYATTQAEDIHLVGSDEVAGPLVIAARSQAGNAVKVTAADIGAFRFASLKRHDDPMFVPGAVRYLDVPGLIALCAPHDINISTSGDVSVAQRVFSATGASQKLKIVERDALSSVIP